MFLKFNLFYDLELTGLMVSFCCGRLQVSHGSFEPNIDNNICYQEKKTRTFCKQPKREFFLESFYFSFQKI